MTHRLVAAAVAVLLALTGCGGGADPGAAAPNLAFRGTTIDGRPYDATVLAGRPAVLWFWAPWCATCAGQAATVTDAVERYGERLGVLGVAGMGDNAAMRDFVRDLDVQGVTNLDDATGELWRRFRITEQSTYVLLDRAGTPVHTGYLDDQQFTERVTALVG